MYGSWGASRDGEKRSILTMAGNNERTKRSNGDDSGAPGAPGAASTPRGRGSKGGGSGGDGSGSGSASGSGASSGGRASVVGASERAPRAGAPSASAGTGTGARDSIGGGPTGGTGASGPPAGVRPQTGPAPDVIAQNPIRVEAPPPRPGAVPIESLGSGRDRSKKAGTVGAQPAAMQQPIRRAIETICAGVFAMPALMGYGPHWYLSPQERKQLGEDGEAALGSMPQKQVKQFTDFINRYAPGANFAISVGVMGWVRLTESQRLYAAYEAKQRAANPGAGDTASGQSAGNNRGATAANSGNGRPAPSAGSRVAELFGGSE